MFDELKKYKTNDHFFFNPTDSLEAACNAPEDKDGMYLVYELKLGRIELVYVGTSGIRVPGIFKDGLFGLKNAIVNGIESGTQPRSQEWPVKMLVENIDALDIYWYVTYKGNLKDHPEQVQQKILDIHKYMFDEYPRWNRQAKTAKKPFSGKRNK